ncbi:MAG: hypothetical protein ACLQAT_20220 [Candidatus Binataceae bacterium]
MKIARNWMREVAITAALWGCMIAPGRAAPLTTAPVDNGQPMEVKIGLFIANLAAVQDASQTFDLVGYLTMTWLDPRLVRSPNEDQRPRSFKSEELWTPDYEFANAYAPVAILSTTLTAQPNGLVMWVQHFSAHLSTETSLRKFPFDKQRLEITIKPYANGPVVRFVSDDGNTGISNEGYVGLAEWRIDRLFMTSADAALFAHQPPVSKATFLLEISRLPNFYTWKGFIPIFLMVAITFSVFWIDDEQFDWQAKIVITMMLSLVAFSFAMEKSLPRVSYLTFFDGVYLTGLVFEFLVMCELVVVRTLIRKGSRQWAARIHWHARYVYPGVYLLMLGGTVIRFFLASGGT